MYKQAKPLLHGSVYSNLDVLCLAELHSPLQGRSIQHFNIASEIPGLNANGTGLAVFVHQRILSTPTILLHGRRSNQDRTIELIALKFESALCLFIYCNPTTTPTFLRKTLSHTLSFLTQQTLWTEKIYCLGDFNQALNTSTKTYFQQHYNLSVQETEFPTHTDW